LLLCDLEICNADWFYCLYGTFSRYIWIAWHHSYHILSNWRKY
jgi:hypothetical protein